MFERKTKKTRWLLKFSVIVLLISAIIFVSYTINVNKKKKALENVILKLNNYRQSHGFYPAELTIVDNDADWLYYYPDSAKASFTLSYTNGIFGVNSAVYDSKTKKWISKFNY